MINGKLIFAALTIAALRAGAQTPLACTASITAAPLRRESIAELLGDVLLECKGGSPNSGGERIEVLIATNVPITSRDLPSTSHPAWGFVDALLLVDDPAPADQVPCVFPAGASACPPESNANVFQGRRIQENSIAFQSVPIAPPGDRATRTLRIVNVRGDLTRLTEVPPNDQPKLTILVYSNGRAVPVQNAVFTLPAPKRAWSFALRTETGAEVPAKQPALVLPRSQLPQGRPEPLRSFRLSFAELSRHGFRRRNFGTSAADGTMTVSQNVPGVPYMTETGFYNSRFPEANGLNTAGRAEMGDRLRVEFTGIPKDVGIWIGARDLPAVAGAAPKALLTYTDGAKELGDFSRVHPELGDYAQLYVDNGTTTATWEIVSADPDEIETLNFTVALVAIGGSPALGSATVTARLLPTAAAVPAARPMYPTFAKQEGITGIGFQIVNSTATPTITVLPSASLSGPAVAPDSIASIFAEGLPIESVAAPGPPASELDNVSVAILDAIGVPREALLYAVSPTQINFVVSGETKLGPAAVQVFRSRTLIASGFTSIDRVAPGIFTASGGGSGPPVGEALRNPAASGSGDSLAAFNAGTNTWEPAPVDLPAGEEAVYLSLLATGIRNRSSIGNVQARIGGIVVPVMEIGKIDEMPGVDRAILGPLPVALKGAGAVSAILAVDGKQTNAVTLRFR